jgi:hypothetical protein
MRFVDEAMADLVRLTGFPFLLRRPLAAVVERVTVDVSALVAAMAVKSRICTDSDARRKNSVISRVLDGKRHEAVAVRAVACSLSRTSSTRHETKYVCDSHLKFPK